MVDKKNFKQDEKVMIRRIGDGGEYRAKVVGIMAQLPEQDFYIVELTDDLPGCLWSHACMTDACLDAGWN
tara:strand:+ start:2865 stop:3074 length:210 start_codon:yes stop_codon:yes gene_type:complete